MQLFSPAFAAKPPVERDCRRRNDSTGGRGSYNVYKQTAMKSATETSDSKLFLQGF